MNILLINPPYGFKETGGIRQNFKYVLNRFPSFGLPYLAAVAEKKGHVVKIFDATLGGGYEEIKKVAEKFMPQMIGITATDPTFRNALSVAFSLRKVLPEAIFVCGGAHPTASPVESLNTEAFDFLVLGEGEETFLELISYLENKPGYLPDNIHGIAFKRDGKIIITPLRERIGDLDSLPFPARHLLPPLNTYRLSPNSYRRFPVGMIMTSRGCPTFCTFCDRTVFGEKFRQRSVSNVIAEVEDVILKYQAQEIHFCDDTFTVDPAFVEGICKGMKKLRPPVPWTCLTKVTAVDFNMLKMMRESGCWQVFFGLESGDDYILRHLGKCNSVRQNKQAVFWAKKVDLCVWASFVVGTPWETKESFRKTIKFSKQLPLDFAHFNKFVPYSGTKIYKDLIAKGYKISFDNGAYASNFSNFMYSPEGFNKPEYARFLIGAYKEFYLRPGYLVNRLFSIRSFSEFTGLLKGFYSIVSL